VWQAIAYFDEKKKKSFIRKARACLRLWMKEQGFFMW